MGAGWEHVFAGHEHPAEPMINTITVRAGLAGAQRPQRLMVRDGGPVCFFPEVSQAKGPILAGTTGKRISLRHLLQGPLLVCACAVAVLCGCCGAPKELGAHYKYAYRWTFAQRLSPAQDTRARGLWQRYLEAKASWWWAIDNPPSVTGFRNREEFALEDGMHEADRKLFEFLEGLK